MDSISTFLHVDMDAFFASVEQRDHPEYRGLPVIIGSPPTERGVVSTCSYEAREYGVHSAMASREAYRLCPNGVFLPGNHKKYSEVSKDVMAILESFTPIVEVASIDEAYMDVTGSIHLFGDGVSIAKQIRSEIKTKLGLPASIGIGTKKYIAKICSDLAKPDGFFAAPTKDSEIISFLGKLDIGVLPGVGKVANERLNSFGYQKILDIQKSKKKDLVALVGEHFASYLFALAFGKQERSFSFAQEEKSISREYTFGTDETDYIKLVNILRELCDSVGAQLRESHKYATTAKIKLRWKNFTTITRQKQIARPISDDFSIYEEALKLFESENIVAPVRLIGFGVGGLVDTPAEPELDLFGSLPGRNNFDLERKTKLSLTVDELRKKLGKDKIKRGSSFSE